MVRAGYKFQSVGVGHQRSGADFITLPYIINDIALRHMINDIALRSTINQAALRRGPDGHRRQRAIPAQYQNRLGIWRENNLGDSGQDLLHCLQV